jgi:hypothetical protein
MRHLLATAVFVSIFALSGATALANDNNDGRLGRADPPSTPDGGADGVPCQGLYTAGVGLDPATRPTGGASYGTPGYAHVFENDEEMCHGR